MKFLVFDLEATCWNSPGNELRVQEIIEIGACILDPYGEIETKFQSFIRPVKNPILSPYCRNLTMIEQPDIDRAKSFKQVMERFFEWADPETEEYLFCAWGDADKELIRSDAKLHNFSIDWISPYLDIKDRYHRNRNIQKKMGLDKVLYLNGFAFEGRRHRALYDALNLAKLVSKYKDEWHY